MSSSEAVTADPKPVSNAVKEDQAAVKGSEPSHAQNESTKEHKAIEIVEQVKSKLDSGFSVSQEEAKLVESKIHRAGESIEPNSIAAKAQSAADKQANFDQMEKHVKAKLDAGEAPTQDEARVLLSREHRLTGHLPEPGSITAKAQSEADKHTKIEKAAEAHEKEEKEYHAESGSPTGQAHDAADKILALENATKDVKAKVEAEAASHSTTTPSLEQAKETKEAKELGFKKAANIIVPKMLHDPEHITKEDADLLHSTDRRAHSTVEKGGVTAQAQRLAAKNEASTKQ